MPNPTGINQYTKGGGGQVREHIGSRIPRGYRVFIRGLPGPIHPSHNETMKAVAGHNMPGKAAFKQTQKFLKAREFARTSGVLGPRARTSRIPPRINM